MGYYIPSKVKYFEYLRARDSRQRNYKQIVLRYNLVLSLSKDQCLEEMIFFSLGDDR